MVKPLTAIIRTGWWVTIQRLVGAVGDNPYYLESKSYLQDFSFFARSSM